MAERRHPEIEALAELMERERAAILGGDLAALARMAEAKEALVGRVARLSADSAGLERLRRLASRNGVLLAAAAQGVRAGMARLKQIVEGPGPLVTYDVSGRRTTLGGAGNQVIRRA
jgi:flagellar biosynthesis/type III secretory pathway chaperone